jgi:hypothetical protein
MTNLRDIGTSCLPPLNRYSTAEVRQNYIPFLQPSMAMSTLSKHFPKYGGLMGILGNG